LQSQYDAAKGVNRVQLALYYGIGKFISIKTRKGVWGTNALQTISDKLRKDLPGLRGFSANSLKNMRKFYENWIMLDAANSDTNLNSTIAIVELEEDENVVEVGAMHIQKVNNFPVEDFLEYRLLIIYELLKEQRILRLVITISTKQRKSICKLIS
jgi:hypothetical protein